MPKKFKIPILACLFIMVLFIAKSLTTFELIEQDDTLKSLFQIMKFEEKVKQSFIERKFLPNSLIFKYAIYDENGTEIFSNLHKKPNDLKFITLKDENTLFYKDFFFINKTPYFLIISQEISNRRNFFIITLMLTFTFILVAFVLYLSYLASIKPYQNAQKYMNNFFNDAMHELKTPLGIAGINLEMLGIENKQTKRIKNALKQMQITYEDIEYYIKRGYIIFPNEIIDLSEYLIERVKFLLSMADAKRMKVVFDDIDRGVNIVMSKMALQRVIDNTITNAIKYSPQDSQIIIKLKRQDDGIAIFSVQDFGCGIKDVKKAFKRYERENLAQGGFGLGLSIVSDICEKYSINYDVKTKLNEGSTFFYKFHIAKLDFTKIRD